MDVFSTELGIRLSFVKTSEFRGEGGGLNPQTPPPRYVTVKNQGNASCFCKITERPLKFYEIKLVPLFIYLPLCNHILYFDESAPGTITKFLNTTCLIISNPSKPQKVLHLTNFHSEMPRNHSTPSDSSLM
jgi:hypothetical protein